MPPRYPVFSTDPRTATPSAPPTIRVVSFIAEPTPALPGGSELMTDSVAGAIAVPMPSGEHEHRDGERQVARGLGHERDAHQAGGDAAHAGDHGGPAADPRRRPSTTAARRS